MTLRRNPDAIALLVIGVIVLVLSIPRTLLEESHGYVAPLKCNGNAQFLVAGEHLQAGREALKAKARHIREALRYLIPLIPRSAFWNG